LLTGFLLSLPKTEQVCCMLS